MNNGHQQIQQSQAPEAAYRSPILAKVRSFELRFETKIALLLASLGLLAVVVAPIATKVIGQVPQPKPVPVGTGVDPAPIPSPTPVSTPADINALSDQMAVLLSASEQVQGMAIQLEADRLLAEARKDRACNSDPNCALTRYRAEALRQTMDGMFRLRAIQQAQSLNQGGQK